jgi:hypothetical protein
MVWDGLLFFSIAMVKGLREMSRSRMELHVHDAIDDHGMDGSRERSSQWQFLFLFFFGYPFLSSCIWCNQVKTQTRDQENRLVVI